MYDLSKYKFIISSGCSYGKIPQSLQEKKNKTLYTLDENCVIIDLQQDSQSAQYSGDSIIHTVEKLIQYGALIDNLFVINEWTGWDRTHMVFPQETVNQILSNFDFIPYDTIRHSPTQDLNEFLNNILGFKMMVNSKFKNHCPIVLIDSLDYINPSHLDVSDYRNTNYHFWIKFYQEIHAKIQNETLINDYFNSILKLQFYLKSKNIKYKFHFIHSTLSNFFKDSNGNVYQDFQSRYDWDETYFTCIEKEKEYDLFYSNLNEENDIINTFPGITNKFNQVDLSKFWLYETDKFRYGGIDEYVMDNFPYFGYSSKLTDATNIKYSIEHFNNHPANILYLFVAKEVLNDCSFISFDLDKLNDLKNQIYHEVNYGNDVENEYFFTLKTLTKKFNRDLI